MPKDRAALLEIVTREVADERVVEAFSKIARERFVPSGSERHAYVDRPVPLPHGQTTSQPSLIARMVEAVAPSASDLVLEVGTGYGFQTALLAELAKEVVSIERFPELAESARRNLAREGYSNVTVVVGDGWQGHPERAPYDAIVVSAAAEELPRSLVSQMADGGRLVVPIARMGRDDVVLYVKHGDVLSKERLITPARFVPLVRGAADA